MPKKKFTVFQIHHGCRVGLMEYPEETTDASPYWDTPYHMELFTDD